MVAFFPEISSLDNHAQLVCALSCESSLRGFVNEYRS